MSQVDFMASFASMLDVDLKDWAPDSLDVLTAFLGETQIGRSEIVGEAINKSQFLRQGKWVYLQPVTGAKMNYQTNTELGSSLDPQLYNMDYDIGQRKNVADLHQDLVEKMDQRLTEINASIKTRE